MAPESVLAHKPPALSFVEASTIPQAGAIAAAGHGRCGRPAPGCSSTVRGGGTGMFAIQLAKQARAHVTAVDNAGKLDHMRALGADEVLDYRRDDFTRQQPYDLVLDLVAHRSVRDYRRALAPGGRYRCVGGPARTVLSVLIGGAVVGRLSGRRIGVLAVKPGPAHFEPLAAAVRRRRGDASASTAPSPSTRCPRRWRTSARAGRSARSSSRSGDPDAPWWTKVDLIRPQRAVSGTCVIASTRPRLPGVRRLRRLWAARPGDAVLPIWRSCRHRHPGRAPPIRADRPEPSRWGERPGAVARLSSRGTPGGGRRGRRCPRPRRRRGSSAG